MNVAICAGASIPQKDKVHCNMSLPGPRKVSVDDRRVPVRVSGTAEAAIKARKTGICQISKTI